MISVEFKGTGVWFSRYRMRDKIVWSFSCCRDNAPHGRKKSQGVQPMFLLLRSERGGDLGSLRVKAKNLLNGANGERKYGKRKRSKDEWETKQAGDFSESPSSTHGPVYASEIT